MSGAGTASGPAMSTMHRASRTRCDQPISGPRVLPGADWREGQGNCCWRQDRGLLAITLLMSHTTRAAGHVHSTFETVVCDTIV